jgi:hypothetical protein
MRSWGGNFRIKLCSAARGPGAGPIPAMHCIEHPDTGFSRRSQDLGYMRNALIGFRNTSGRAL